jgi:hypothetical protein
MWRQMYAYIQPVVMGIAHARLPSHAPPRVKGATHARPPPLHGRVLRVTKALSLIAGTPGEASEAVAAALAAEGIEVDQAEDPICKAAAPRSTHLPLTTLGTLPWRHYGNPVSCGAAFWQGWSCPPDALVN